MTACNAISPSPFSDIFEDDFINAVIDDELTRYGETSGKDSNGLYTNTLYPKRSKMYYTAHINSV